MRKIPIAALKRGRRDRPSNYAEIVMAAGRVEGDHVLLTEEQFLALQKRFSNPGLGDVIEKVLSPVVRIADRALGTSLGKCGACQRRKSRLNRLFRWPFLQRDKP